MYQLGYHGRIFVKFDIGDFYGICLEIPSLVTVGQTHRTLHEDLITVYFGRGY